MLREDGEGNPRFRAKAPSFDELVRPGFEQVRADAARRPVLATRLIELFGELREAGGEPVRQSAEVDRQAALIRAHVSSVADIDADRVKVEDGYERRAPHGPLDEGAFADDLK